MITLLITAEASKDYRILNQNLLERYMFYFLLLSPGHKG